MIFWPGWGTVVILVGCLGLCLGIDVLLAPSARSIAIHRSTNQPVRLTEPRQVWVEIVNLTSRKMRGMVRDGWQPSAQDAQPVHSLQLSGASQRFDTVLTPSRRGTVRTQS